ncbi:hypothetical protein IW147_005543 [Coemansia sp. RSA 720]|nr:hypothetical protein IW147_005543 [Coemansia sp. RSA 720]
MSRVLSIFRSNPRGGLLSSGPALPKRSASEKRQQLLKEQDKKFEEKWAKGDWPEWVKKGEYFYERKMLLEMGYSKDRVVEALEISKLSGERVESTEDLVDARILIDITTAADPEYFATASLVLPSQHNEPNLDALAQLARLLLRYIEQGLGTQLARDYVPRVQSLVAPPFDDMWRLLVLVVSVTLLSQRNNAKSLYEELDDVTQTQLRVGIDGMWGEPELLVDGVSGPELLIDVGAPGPELLIDVGASGPDKNSGSAKSSRDGAQNQVTYTTADDSMASVRTSLAQYQSAYSSLAGQSQHSADREPESLNQEPALLPITEASQSVGTIASTIGGRYSRSMVGFEESDDEESNDEENAVGLSDTDSYVSEFSQDLAEYGTDVVSVGINGPNAYAAYVYIGNMLAYVAAGLYLLATTNVPERKSPYFKDYYDMTTAVLKVLLYSGLSAGISVAWVHLLRTQTRKVVWMTTLAAPVVSVGMAVWAATQLMLVPGVEGLLGYRVRNIIVIVASLVLAARFAWSITQRKQEIERSVDIIQLACTVLLQNKELYAFSLLLLALYGSFATISAIFATRLPLFSMTEAAPEHMWGMAGFLFVSFAWTSAVFVQLQRIVVSSVVCQWYFHRHDPHEPLVLHTLQASALSALTQQLGTVVLAATFLFAAKTLHVIELCVRTVVSMLRIIPVSLVTLAIGRPLHMADAWSSYTLVYAGFSGRSFFASSRTVTQLLQQHQLMHAPVVSLIKSTMTCLGLVVAIVFGYVLGVQAVTSMSMHSAFVAVGSSGMVFALQQMATHVLVCTVEALVVCYAIDMEVDSCHSIDVVERMARV